MLSTMVDSLSFIIDEALLYWSELFSNVENLWKIEK